MGTIHDLRDEIVADVDADHAESVRVEPMTAGGDFRHPSADPERSPIDAIQAVLRVRNDDSDLGGRGESWQARLAVHHAMLRVNHAKIPAGFSFAEGDLVIASERPGMPRFRVDRIGKAGRARLDIVLSEIG